MNYLPIFIDISGKQCLVVGGGDIALRKCKLLLKCKASIHLVAPVITPSLSELLATGNHRIEKRDFASHDVAGKALVVAATGSADINQRIHASAIEHNIPVNVVDNPALCTFIFPSIVDRSPVIVAVSSGGTSPILARQLRTTLETLIPANYGKLAEFSARLRNLVRQKFPDTMRRRHFWESVLQGPIAEMVLAHREKHAEQHLRKQLEQDAATQGEVYLVGAGPGDPDLLTFKALRLMQQADIVFYDRLVSPKILELVRKDAELVYAGKEQSDHTIPQGDLNTALIREAQKGKKVLRLKGGDPFIFGRGGEEILELARKKIPFQVVPGITAASGCAAYSGIPLTHRDYAQSVRFLTGHLKNNTINLHWPELMDTSQTLVFYMGLTGITKICQQLIEHGRNPGTPVALIEKGTTPEQRVLVSTLQDLPSLLVKEQVTAPTLTIIGDVVKLHKELEWFNPS